MHKKQKSGKNELLTESNPSIITGKKESSGV
jgi:hypothetical protein